jgi:cyclic pyranopterin phosphate synthase
MPLTLQLLDLDLGEVPAGPGAVVLYDDSDALYVAQTMNMPALVKRILTGESYGYLLDSLANYALLKVDTDKRRLVSQQVGREQAREVLRSCKVSLHPTESRASAMLLKADLIEQLAPRLQVRRKRTRSPNTGQQDPLRELLRVAGRLSHTDAAGRPRMVDVSPKTDTAREAMAKGSVYMSAETLSLIASGGAAKGDVLTTAQLAGVMAAKRTHELIPLCHPLLLTSIDVSLKANEARGAIDITATVRTTGKTGVEMEALTAVSVAALTVYDMAKAVQRDMRIGDIRLVRKSGGKSGDIALE